MLENRPLAQKTLYGAGAFAFVFTAAMAGTGFMITGGLGSGQHAPADPPAYNYDASMDWTNLPEDPAHPEHAVVTRASMQQAPAIQDESVSAPASTVEISGAEAPPNDTSVFSGDASPAPAPDQAPHAQAPHVLQAPAPVQLDPPPAPKDGV